MKVETASLVDRALTDLLSFIVDNRGRTCPTVNDGFPLIATNCIKPDQREASFENVRYVDGETYTNWFRAHPLPGDVIFVCKGSPGRVAVVPDPVPYCIAQDMVALRANGDVVDPPYLYYRLSAPDVQSKIRNMHVGTLIPHFKKGDFGRLRLSIHESVDEQRRIAGVLGALDDLVDTNRQAAARLDALCHAVGQRFIHSLKDRPRVQLDELATICKGYSYKSAELVAGGAWLVNLKNVGRNGEFQPRGLKPLTGN
jgi:type I restriction enzyme S subunit